MDLTQAFQMRGYVESFRPAAVDHARLRHILSVATSTPTFADQAPLRILLVQDDETKRVLRSICEARRENWFRESPEWVNETLAKSGETRKLSILTEAPSVICIFGEIDKPCWREATWNAAERIRLAASTVGLHAQAIHVDSLSFLNSLLEVPQIFTPMAVLAVGEPASVQAIERPEPSLENLLLPYRPQRERLESWNDPIRLGELAPSRDTTERPFLSDKLLLLNIIETASDVCSCTDLDTVFSLVTRELRRLFRYDRASVAYLDLEDGTLRLRNIHKDNGLPVGDNLVIPLEEDNVIGWVILNKSGVRRSEISKDDMFNEQMSVEPLESDCIVPLITGGTVLGTLNIGSYQPHAFTQNDFDILREFGKLVGSAVERLQNISGRTAIDELTGVLSHRRFYSQLATEVARCGQFDLPCSLLLVNLDHFRVLNETFGHEVGDKVLASIAQVIRENVREIDTIARYAGEEFAVILPEATSESVKMVGERIRAAVHSRVHAMQEDSVEVKTSVSIGGSTYKPADNLPEALIAQAKMGLARAKLDGRNRVCVFDASVDQPKRARSTKSE